MKKCFLHTIIFSLFAAIAQAQDENVTWQTPANISGASDVSPIGTYFGTWAPYDGDANNLPVNGVKFEGNSDLPGLSVNFPNNDQNGYGGFHNPGTPNANYNSLLQYAAYCGSSTNGTIVVTWADIPGHTYQIEVWANDGRGLFPGRSETITGGNNTSANVDFGDAPGQYITGTYLADSSGLETITLNGSSSTNGDAPMINLLEVRDVTGANISWQPPANISGATDVSTQGTYFGSWAPASSSPLSVNGVTFQNNSDLPGFSTTGFNASYNSFPNPGTANNNYNTLLQSGAYEYPGPGCTLSWNGLTPGNTYLVQLWVNGNDPSRTETLSGGANTSASINYDPGQYITGTFVAAAGSETITLNGASGDNLPQVNLLQVRNLTAAAVVSNYQSSVLADAPLGYWPLDLTDANAANGIATDLSGNGNNGTYYGITSSGNLVAGPSSYLTNAASFNSAEVYLGSGANPTLLDFGGPITLEAWVQPANTTEGGGGNPADILAKGYDGNNDADELTLRANGGDYFGGTYNGSDNGASAQGGQQTTNWTHLVSTYDGTNWNVYVNGQAAAHAADTVGAIEWQAPWAIGNGTLNGDGRVFQGNLCQVALYNYALTPAQILTHFFEGEVNALPANSVPIIVTQPQPQAGFIGGSATFSVGVVSALPVTNQWYEGNTSLNGQTNATLVLTNLSLVEANNYRVVVGNANGKANSVAAALSVTSPITLEWSANNNNGTWDVTNSADWINESNETQTVFVQGDAVVFDDTVGVPTTVTVNGTVQPSLITVNSSTNDFSLSSGTISGAGSLVKNGTSTLSVTSAGNFTGTATIKGGVLVAGNDFLESVASITITNNSTLDFGGSTMADDTPVTVSGTGAGGEGAIFNSGAALYGQELNINLAGNTTFGASNRWDLTAGSQISGAHNLTLDWSAGSGYGEWNTITVAANVPGITLTNGNLGIKYLDTSFNNPGTVFTVSPNCQMIFWNGGFNGSIHLLSGSQAVIYTAPAAFNGSDLILESNALWESYGNTGATTPVNSAVILNGVAHIVIGDHNMVYTNVISGSGGYVEDYYNHAMVLSASNTYRGPTVINDGPDVALTGTGSISQSSPIFFGGNNPTGVHFDVSGRTDQTFTLAAGQTLGGVGLINGNLTVSSGAILSPGGTNITIGITNGANPVGIIAASNNITLGGNTLIKLDGSGVSDQLLSGTKITYGGTLTLANISGAALANGNSFQIFSAPNLIGSFATISPAIPGPGLIWDTTQLNSFGTLNVIPGSLAPKITNVQLSSGKLIFSGSGGTPSASFVVYSVTNIVSTNWVPVLTNAFNGSGGFSVTNLITPGVPQSFYRIK